jgi:hypothetical protein
MIIMGPLLVCWVVLNTRIKTIFSKSLLPHSSLLDPINVLFNDSLLAGIIMHLVKESFKLLAIVIKKKSLNLVFFIRRNAVSNKD